MIRVEKAGLQTTVQDLGRPGYGLLGVSSGGAADAHALRIGNLLLGNEEGAAALEATLLGPTLVFEEPTLVVLAGGTFDATLDGRPVGPWRLVEAPAGATLAVGPTRSGARVLVCVAGGIAVPAVLGSASPDLAGRFGGLRGRPLAAGDRLPVGRPAGDPRGSRVDPVAAGWTGTSRLLRATPGTQESWFSEESRAAFWEGRFRVLESSDRKGLRLSGPSVAPPSRQLLTEGVPFGSVQVPADAQPIVLFVDQQTTGGYPKIASVVSADRSALAQARPREEVRFLRVTFGEAREALLDQERRLASGEAFLP